MINLKRNSTRCTEDDSQSTFRKNALWNMIASCLNASQMIVLLLLVTRELGTTQAGIFSICFSTSNMLMYVGTYGVRNYQCTDVTRKHSFQDYALWRIITCCLMLFISILFCLNKSYSVDKSIVMLLLCLLKCMECIEDLLLGEYQLQGHLDLSSKLWSFRLVGNLLIFVILIYFSQNLLFACSAMLIFTSICVLMNLFFIYPKFKIEKKRVNLTSVKNIFISTTPIFLYSFLNVYITNSPKYEIDRHMSDEIQAYFAILFTPIFAINLVSEFIYRPSLVQLAEIWNKKMKKEFFGKIFKQSFFILCLTIVLCICSFRIELPILSWLYKTDLMKYKFEYLILLYGGGCSAISYYIVSCLIVQRKQNYMIGIIIMIAIIATIFSSFVVKFMGIMGASILYAVLMTIQMLVLFLICRLSHHKSI